MANNAFRSLYQQFYSVVQSGDEDAAKRFLIEHFTEFDEDVQGELLSAFFEEAVEDRLRVARTQAAALDASRKLEALNSAVADREKALGILASLNNQGAE